MVDPEHSFETFGYLENIAEEEGSEVYDDLQRRLFSARCARLIKAEV